MIQKLTVKREGEFCYPILFEQDFSRLPGALSEERMDNRRICIITDTNVAPLYLEEVRQELQKVSSEVLSFCIPAGEENKNLNTVSEIYRFLIGNGMDRKGLLAALGGGVVGDITGFTAATYLRGIGFFQIPTTLLSQVDSSVGGKTGVDMEAWKNMVGAFYQPRLVYMNMKTLQTLPEEEFICGMGEVLKTGLICDGSFFRRTVKEYRRIRALDPVLLPETVRRCCEIKAGVVERDPREQGERALLNLGHTVGHAVEKLKDFRLRHGQCVGLGLIAAAELSKRRSLLSEEEYREILEGLKSCGLPDRAEGLLPEEILLATRKDKKMENGHIRFILMNGIGHSLIDRSITDDELLAAIRVITE